MNAKHALSKKVLLDLPALSALIKRGFRNKKRSIKGINPTLLKNFCDTFEEGIKRVPATISGEENDGVIQCSASDGCRRQKQIIVPLSCIAEIKSPIKNMPRPASEFARLM